MASSYASRIIGRLRTEIRVYGLALKHPRTPRIARWLLGLALAYLISPVDIIPDFIPFAGQLDDLIIVPLLVWLALRMIPPDVLVECRNHVARQQVTTDV